MVSERRYHMFIGATAAADLDLGLISRGESRRQLVDHLAQTHCKSTRGPSQMGAIC